MSLIVVRNPEYRIIHRQIVLDTRGLDDVIQDVRSLGKPGFDIIAAPDLVSEAVADYIDRSLGEGQIEIDQRLDRHAHAMYDGIDALYRSRSARYGSVLFITDDPLANHLARYVATRRSHPFKERLDPASAYYVTDTVSFRLPRPRITERVEERVSDIV